MTNLSARLRLTRALLLGTVIFICLSSRSFCQATQISSVQISPATGKSYVEANGEPYLMYGVQIRLDNYLGGNFSAANWASALPYFANAKAVGFKTVIVPLWWWSIEPTQGTYTFSNYVDYVLADAKQYGLNVQFLWLGSDVGGEFCGPSYIGQPEWNAATGCWTYTPTNPSVYPLFAGAPAGDPEPDVSNANLIAAETAALSALMKHIAATDTTNAVVMVQMQNEPDQEGYYPQTWTPADEASELWEGGQSIPDIINLNNLSNVIHNSPRDVVTRYNAGDQYLELNVYNGRWQGTPRAVGSISYYPRTSFSSRMVGGVFQGSNNKSTWTTLATITALPAQNQWTTISLSGGSASAKSVYRYLRYYGPTNGYCDVAEVGFYDTTGLLITGANINDGHGAWGGLSNIATDAYDQNTSTFYDSSLASGGWTGIDSGSVGLNIYGNDYEILPPGTASALDLPGNVNYTPEALGSQSTYISNVLSNFSQGRGFLCYQLRNTMTGATYDDGIFRWTTPAANLWQARDGSQLVPGFTNVTENVTSDITDFNSLIYKADKKLATLTSPATSAAFNLANTTTVNDTENVGSNSVNFVSSNNGAGLAMLDTNGFPILLNFRTGNTWTLPSSWVTSYDASVGYYDANDNWVEQSTTPFTGNSLTLSDGQVVRVLQNLALNPGFESGMTDWTASGANPSDAYTSTQGPMSGTTSFAEWSPTAYQVYTSQTITGLANGTYTLRAYARGSGGQISCYMNAKNYGGSEIDTNLPAVGWYTPVTIPSITVTNGKCTIGFYSNANANNWINVDNVEFYRIN